MDKAGRNPTVVLATAASGLGVLVNAASGLGAPSQLIGGWPGVTALSAEVHVHTAMPVAAVVAGLLLIRRWPWLLLGGSLLTLPAVLTPYITQFGAHPSLRTLGYAGTWLVLIAVLAAAQELMEASATGAGAALCGCTAGALLTGAAFVGAAWLSLPAGVNAAHLLLALAGAAGGAVAVARLRGAAGPRPHALPVIAGGLAAALVFVTPVLTTSRAARILEVSADSLARRDAAQSALTGLVILGCAVLIATLAGVWGLAGVAAAATVQAGVAAPLLLGSYGVAFHRTAGLAAALTGLVAGAVLARTKWRTPVAAGGTVLCALVLLIAVAATGGAPEKIVAQGRWIPAALLLALLVATATCTVAAAARVTTRRGGTPAVLGPVLAALVAGGQGALAAAQLDNGQAESSMLAGVHHLGPSLGLVLAAGALVAGIGAVRWLTAHASERPSPGSQY
ncbi:hypothetical protein [Actinomadura macrotermitis]|uniref:MFS transporter n=1 Tax=Actinomadura macrotermitis TaxID=2585200 RepID=A0A7K0BUW7_9ACTN|nr:hypothetical protein [Actinomadura macrotermitis]MQY04937.1 hypothetical protein [Actinomadura macrotermitis]